MATLTPGQLAGLAAGAGFSGAARVTAVAVALAESGGRTDATNVNRAGTSRESRDLGLWQINDRAHPWIKGQNWQDPAVNAAAAYRVYKEAGGSFRPWVTYNSGASAKFQLQAAQGVQAPAQVDNAGWLDKLNPLDELGAGVDAAADGVKLAASGAVWVSNPHNWLRVVYVVAGGALIVAGLQLTVSGRVAKVAAPLTGAAKTVVTKGKVKA